MLIWISVGEATEGPVAPVQPVFGDPRFPGPREPHPVRFQGQPIEGQHPPRFPAGPMEGQQAWLQQQQQQQQRFPMETVGPRMPAPGVGGDMRFPGAGPFPAAQTQAGPQPMPQGKNWLLTNYLCKFGNVVNESLNLQHIYDIHHCIWEMGQKSFLLQNYQQFFGDRIFCLLDSLSNLILWTEKKTWMHVSFFILHWSLSDFSLHRLAWL